MKANVTRNRRIFLGMLVLLLVSSAYLALEISLYYEGAWQGVQVQGLVGTATGKTFTVEVPERQNYADEDWDIVRDGQLFFKSLPVVVDVETPDDTFVPPPYVPEETVTYVPPKPTCPLVVTGIMLGEQATAILANKQSQMSQTARVGTRLGEFEVIEIARDYVLVKGLDTEFKLEYGGM